MIKFLKKLFLKPQVEIEELKVDYKIADFKVGFTFDYDLKNWEVIDLAMYRWENDVRDYEYTIEYRSEKQYLNYSPASQEFSIYWDAKFNDVCPDARQKMDQGDMDFTFNYQGEKYILSSSAKANIKNSKERFNMVNWLFISENEDQFVSFNKYEDGSKEVYLGKKIKEREVGNIFPSA